MTKEVKEACLCALDIRDEIWKCPTCHQYRKGKKEYTSVSKVIRTLLPTDYSAVPPEVLETARNRGIAVDAYFCEYVKTGTVTLATGERSDVLRRLGHLIDWWDREPRENPEVQKIVYSDETGIAGALDLAYGKSIWDIKTVSQLQPAYALQLGMFFLYDRRGSLCELGILHLTEKGCRPVRYDEKLCSQQWCHAVDWYNTRKQLLKEGQ